MSENLSLSETMAREYVLDMMNWRGDGDPEKNLAGRITHLVGYFERFKEELLKLNPVNPRLAPADEALMVELAAKNHCMKEEHEKALAELKKEQEKEAENLVKMGILDGFRLSDCRFNRENLEALDQEELLVLLFSRMEKQGLFTDVLEDEIQELRDELEDY